VNAWVAIIDGSSLSWEMLPDAALNEPRVWRALIANGIPQTALIRQLPRLTRLGVIGPKDMSTTANVAAKLADPERLRKARVHPVNVLVALRTYASGQGARGQETWQPVSKITDALDAAFYAAFGAVEPSGKRTMLALDVSGSMTAPVSGLPLSCREASAALALVTAATEPMAFTVGFSRGLTQLDISPRQRLDDAIRKVSNLPFDRTDCSLPMLWAAQERAEIDHFSIYTDNETYAGRMHPHQALEAYRQKTGINARLSVVGMTATDFTIADPDDPGSLDVAGFDSAAPSLLSAFARGDI
jgi:60 kDa SS-A/Ro ribonucleoprotein